MNKKIIYPNDEGEISIIIPSPYCSLTIEQIAEKDVPAGKPYKILNESEIPFDNFFRGAWEWEKDDVKLNINKAKEIWLNVFRKARKPILEKLDIDFMRAVENDDINLQKEIAQKKQALRDVTETELPDTLEDIKSTWPEILK